MVKAGHRQCSGCYMSKKKKTAVLTAGLIAFRYFRAPAPQKTAARERERSRLGQWTTVIIPRIISVQPREGEENARTQTAAERAVGCTQIGAGRFLNDASLLSDILKNPVRAAKKVVGNWYLIPCVAAAIF